MIGIKSSVAVKFPCAHAPAFHWHAEFGVLYSATRQKFLWNQAGGKLEDKRSSGSSV